MVGEDVFVVIEVILLEYMLDVIRMINKIGGGKNEAHAHDLSVPPGREQKSQGIAMHRRCTTKQRVTGKVGWGLAAGRCFRSGWVCPGFSHRFCSFNIQMKYCLMPSKGDLPMEPSDLGIQPAAVVMCSPSPDNRGNKCQARNVLINYSATR